MPIRVLVADDQQLMLSALRLFVEAAPDMEVVGEAANGAVAVRQCAALAPDVVLMDMQMPVMDGIEATRIITGEFPATKVIAVTTFATAETVVPALRAGASGYIVKDTAPAELVQAIRDVMEGHAALSPSLTGALVQAIKASPSRESARSAPNSLLTEREFEVVDQLAQGLGNAEIAETLFVSQATVKARLASAMAKLGVTSRVQLVVRACELGLVQPRLRQ
ncbi:MAG: response regulator transcription factor [Dermatophilus congolensis]|nr:response regulator transcription factor [Dermatophilus congolensis]